MRADLIERDVAVGLADRPGKAGAGGGERLEADVLQRQRAADVPGIRDHETSATVQFAERRALVCGRERHEFSPFGFLLAPQ
jgi:hypothetical protein